MATPTGPTAVNSTNTSAMTFENMVIYLKTKSDPRVDKWIMLGGPEPLLAVSSMYLLVVWLLPKLMEKRDPFCLRSLIIPYNIGLTLTSLYMVYEFFMSSIMVGYSFRCQPVDYSDNPMAMRIASALWLFTITKIVELLETVIFILRKKKNQITFLHVYHHCTMMWGSWLTAKYVPGGQAFFTPMLNSAVHCVMYLYYGLASLGPHMQKYLWWKRYITKLQLTQFFLVMFYASYNLYHDCDFPPGFNIFYVTYAFIMVLLFSNFYHHAYVAKKKKA